MASNSRQGPLARFTVLDLTRARSGPTAARQMADWGADVIKIAEPGTPTATAVRSTNVMARTFRISSAIAAVSR